MLKVDRAQIALNVMSGLNKTEATLLQELEALGRLVSAATCAHGARSRGIESCATPTRDLNHWRSLSVSETAAIGNWNSCDAMRVIRSKASLGGVSRRFSLRRTSSRAASSPWLSRFVAMMAVR